MTGDDEKKGPNKRSSMTVQRRLRRKQNAPNEVCAIEGRQNFETGNTTYHVKEQLCK